MIDINNIQGNELETYYGFKATRLEGFTNTIYVKTNIDGVLYGAVLAVKEYSGSAKQLVLGIMTQEDAHNKEIDGSNLKYFSTVEQLEQALIERKLWE